MSIPLLAFLCVISTVVAFISLVVLGCALLGPHMVEMTGDTIGIYFAPYATYPWYFRFPVALTLPWGVAFEGAKILDPRGGEIPMGAWEVARILILSPEECANVRRNDDT